ncbi:hypothetical protein ACWCOZ_02450 [Streptomyces sp. NPDC001840]
MIFLEREEYVWIHECMGEDAEDLTGALAETGRRWGEATALQPRDVRRRNGRPAVRVQRAWKRDENGKPYMGAPKTKKSRRMTVVTARLDRMLRRRAQGLAPNDLDPSAPLPGFLLHSGLVKAAEGLPAVPRQQSGPPGDPWKDASDMAQQGTAYGSPSSHRSRRFAADARPPRRRRPD